MCLSFESWRFYLLSDGTVFLIHRIELHWKTSTQAGIISLHHFLCSGGVHVTCSRYRIVAEVIYITSEPRSLNVQMFVKLPLSHLLIGRSRFKLKEVEDTEARSLYLKITSWMTIHQLETPIKIINKIKIKVYRVINKKDWLKLLIYLMFVTAASICLTSVQVLWLFMCLFIHSSVHQSPYLSRK